VLRALARRPEDRYARADDFARALGEHLFRTGTAIGAEDVGNYVRTLCPEAFAAQRKLISKLGSGRLKSPAVPVTASALGPTFTRPAEGASSGLEPRSPSKVAVAVSVLAAMTAAAAVTGWWVSRRDEKRERVDLERVEAAAAERVATAPIPPPEVTPPPPVETARRDAGHPRRPTGPVEYLSPKGLEDVFSDRGGQFARAGALEGLVLGGNYVVVGGQEGMHRRKLGTATVLEVVGPHLARLSLDEAAQSAGGHRFIVLPESTAPVASTASSTPAPVAPLAKGKGLHGHAQAGGIPRTFTVFNDDARAWTECSVALPRKRRYFLGSLAAHAKQAVPVFLFSADPGSRVVEARTLGVDCHEGSADFSFEP
jgi:hypothetical protein